MSQTIKNDSTSIQLIGKEKQLDEKDKIILEITNEGMEYLNQLNSNSIGIISLIGPQDSDKSSFANVIIGDKAAFDTSEKMEGIYMWGQPIVHQENTDLLVLDTESLYKQSNLNTSYDKQTFILSCLLSSIMIYNTNESIVECISKFSNLAKESLSCLKKIEGKELTPAELPLVYFLLHNINIDTSSAVSQFKSLAKDNPIFVKYFNRFKIIVLKKAGENIMSKSRTMATLKLEDLGALDDQDYKQKAKSVKDQIMNDLQPKKINNCNLDGKCLFGLIQSFVDSLNKGENIILINQFNNVLSLCLSEVVDQINYSFTSEQLNKKMISNTSFEETYLEICKVSFKDCINEQFDKFKSMPIVKISPSPSLFNGIKLIFIKCLDVMCEIIQGSVDKKAKLINDISKLDYVFSKKLDGGNIEQVLYKLSNFINEKILTPLFEPNNQKFQNSDQILQILKTKICEKIEKISPMIQNIINKLTEDKQKIEEEFNNFKSKHKTEMEQKNDEINELKLRLEKQDRIMKEKELETINLINIEKDKYEKKEEKYKNELNEKSSHINELIKHSNTLNQYSSVGGNVLDTNNNDIMKLEAIKNDYNYITNILVKYKMLVNKLISDKDFFFENMLIDKSIGDLQRKYPDIFGLLSEKDSLEDMKFNYDKKIEILNNEKTNLKEKINIQAKEINELKEKLEGNNKELEEQNTIIESQASVIKNRETVISGLENKINENLMRYKKLSQEKDKVNTNDNNKEINILFDIIESIMSKQKTKYHSAFQNLNQNSQEKLIQLAKTYNNFKI